MIRAAINIVAAVSIANVALAADQEIVSTNQFTTLGIYSNGASITARANQQANSDYSALGIQSNTILLGSYIYNGQSQHNATINTYANAAGESSVGLSASSDRSSAGMIINAESVNFYQRDAGATTTNAVRLTGVAAGVAGTDAVNVNQLNAASNQYDKLRRNLSELEAQLSTIENDSMRGIAALASINNATAPEKSGKLAISIGAGSYMSKTATGISFAYRAGVDANRAIIRAGVGYAGAGQPVYKIGIDFEI